MKKEKNWHEEHIENSSFGQKLADNVANYMGSWKFIIIQTILIAIWMFLNVVAWCYHWDIYPFILLNLVFSTQAAYAAPIIMMAQNRQNDRDRAQAKDAYIVDLEAKKEIEALQVQLNSIEDKKLDKIIKLLENIKKKI